MLCEKYKPALIETAITGAEPAPTIGAHVESCALCAAELMQQRSLIAAIDANLHRQMNAPVPASMLYRLEAHLAEQTAFEPVRSLRRRWLCIGAAIAAAAVVFFALPHLRSPITNLPTGPASRTASSMKQSPAIVTMVLKPATSEEIRRDRIRSRTVARPEPEVLVPPEERIAFAHFIADLHGREEKALALSERVRELREQKVVPVEAPDIQISSLTVPPIEESETSSNK
jgi:hypothetical protein